MISPADTVHSNVPESKPASSDSIENSTVSPALTVSRFEAIFRFVQAQFFFSTVGVGNGTPSAIAGNGGAVERRFKTKIEAHKSIRINRL